MLFPVVQRQPHDLLRGTGTFDDTSRLGKDGVAFFGISNHVENFVAIILDKASDRTGVVSWYFALTTANNLRMNKCWQQARPCRLEAPAIP